MPASAGTHHNQRDHPDPRPSVFAGTGSCVRQLSDHRCARDHRRGQRQDRGPGRPTSRMGFGYFAVRPRLAHPRPGTSGQRSHPGRTLRSWMTTTRGLSTTSQRSFERLEDGARGTSVRRWCSVRLRDRERRSAERTSRYRQLREPGCGGIPDSSEATSLWNGLSSWRSEASTAPSEQTRTSTLHSD